MEGLAQQNGAVEGLSRQNGAVEDLSRQNGAEEGLNRPNGGQKGLDRTGRHDRRPLKGLLIKGVPKKTNNLKNYFLLWRLYFLIF